MKVATWNVNGIKARKEQLLAWLGEAKPDVACLQEIKCADEAFPAADFENVGYNVRVHGQKGLHGVAILSRLKFDEVAPGLPGEPEDVQSRYLEAIIPVGGTVLRVASIYLPNGNPIGTEKFAYKNRWMDRLERHMRTLLAYEEPLVVAGDYNVIPEPLDARRPDTWRSDALFQPEPRIAYRRYLNLGLTDAIRACHPQGGLYTFWDYQAGSWQKDDGIRIDHALISPQAADRLVNAGVDRFTRTWERPSDHVPVWIELAFGR